MNISIRQIEAFYYTAKLGSLSQAAEKLCITQAAASMALKGFEDQLGERLFERNGKKLVLNERGSAILETTAELLSKACELVNFFSDKPCMCGNLSIGTIPSIANYVLPEYITNFININRMSNIYLNIGNSEETIDKVIKFEVDMGIIEKCCCQPVIDLIPWLDDELAIFVSPTHPLAEIDSVSIDDLQSFDWIMREHGAGSRRVLETQFKSSAMKVNVMLEMEHNEAVKNAVAKGGVVGCLSRYVLTDMENSGKIKILKTPFLDLRRKFHIAVHREKYQTKILKEFLGSLGIREALKNS